jgi:bifunctional DNA-binding transcriptional regulator/antitoxin component of YhaV-PrlF toxin-antitoxin module
MLTQIVKIDKHGRIEVPEKMRKASGLFPETDVLIELKDNGVLIKPKLAATPITQRIAEMDLPVSDWAKLEKEIEQGYLK